jgi:hypothetical protein
MAYVLRSYIRPDERVALGDGDGTVFSAKVMTANTRIIS